MCKTPYPLLAATIKPNGDVTMALFKKKGKKVQFDQISVGERAALGCRNPHPTANFQRAFKIMASRRGSKW